MRILRYFTSSDVQTLQQPSTTIRFVQQFNPHPSRIKMEKDHSTKTVEAKGASVSHASGGKIPWVHARGIQWHLENSLPMLLQLLRWLTFLSLFPQIPQARLVTGRRLVCATGQLESKHGDNDGGHVWDYVGGVEHQCREGIQATDAREGQVFPKSIVRTPSSSTNWLSSRVLILGLLLVGASRL